MRRYTFTRWWAHAMIVIGVLILTLTITAITIVALIEPPRPDATWPKPTPAIRVAGGTVLLVVGIVLAAPFIVTGQLVLVFLDMRARLQRLDRRSRRLEAHVAAQDGGDDNSSLARRLRRR